MRWIDMLKGLGIISVVIGHTCDPASKLSVVIFSYHMPLFFFISGYLFNLSKYKNNFSLLFSSSAERLLKPYLMTFLIINIYSYLFLREIYPYSFLGGSMWSLLNWFIYGVGYPVKGLESMISPIGPMWFLCCLFIARCLFGGIMTHLRFTERNTWYLFLIVILFVYLGIRMGKIHVYPWSLDIAFVSLYFMFFGYLFRKHNLFYKIPGYLYVFLFAFWLYDISKGGISMNNRSYFSPLISFNGAICGTVVQTKLCIIFERLVEEKMFKHFKTIDKVLENLMGFIAFAGKNSLIILIFHVMDTTFFHFDKLFPLYNSVIVQHNYIVLFVLRMLFSFLIIYLIRHPLKSVIGSWYS